MMLLFALNPRRRCPLSAALLVALIMMILFVGCKGGDQPPAPGGQPPEGDTGPVLSPPKPIGTAPAVRTNPNDPVQAPGVPPPSGVQTYVDPRTGKTIDSKSAEALATLPFIPSGKREFNKRDVIGKIKDRAVNATDLPNFYHSTVFQNRCVTDLEIPPDATVAELYAGTGALAASILAADKKFARLYVVESGDDGREVFSFLLNRFFSQRKDDVQVVAGDFTDWRLPADSLDLAVIYEGDFFVPALVKDEAKIAEVVAGLKNLRATFKPEGELYVFQTAPWSAAERPLEAPAASEEVKASKETMAFRDKQLDAMAGVFKQAGFRVAEKKIDDKCQCYILKLNP
ncbi:MAG: rRNA adenine N-6-methyltransferase family protein [Candidatus Lernaella stagnicola]|nr:rRNA adenine N-6-methyltransferase family protein [Candidatus Lernaella stagnicola]